MKQERSFFYTGHSTEEAIRLLQEEAVQEGSLILYKREGISPYAAFQNIISLPDLYCKILHKTKYKTPLYCITVPIPGALLGNMQDMKQYYLDCSKALLSLYTEERVVIIYVPVEYPCFIKFFFVPLIKNDGIVKINGTEMLKKIKLSKIRDTVLDVDAKYSAYRKEDFWKDKPLEEKGEETIQKRKKISDRTEGQFIEQIMYIPKIKNQFVMKAYQKRGNSVLEFPIIRMQDDRKLNEIDRFRLGEDLAPLYYMEPEESKIPANLGISYIKSGSFYLMVCLVRVEPSNKKDFYDTMYILSKEDLLKAISEGKVESKSVAAFYKYEIYAKSRKKKGLPLLDSAYLETL